MAGRHQAPYTRYTNANNSYTNSNNSNTLNNNNNNSLNIPFPPQNNGSANTPYSSSSSLAYNTTPTNTTSPYSTTSSPGYHSPNVSRQQLNSTIPLKKYSLQPPAKLLPYSKSMPSLGFPGMFPQRSNQDEDILTEANMKTGFTDRSSVANDQTCAHDIIYGKLQDDQRLLNDMGSFMVDVLMRKRNAARISGPSLFKPPSRTALIESMKEQWIHELANGTVTLRKLARNVPHGYKGEKLLETLATRQVPFLRAIWYIKIVGLSEMSQRNVSNAGSSTSHAYNWTIVVTGYLKKQLADLATTQSNSNTSTMRGYRNSNVPGVSPAVNANDNQTRPWITPEAKTRFESRWAYSTKLTRWQYCEGLLDQRTFLKWSLDTLALCSSFEIMWVVLIGLVQDYIDEYKRNRTLTKLLIETLIKTYNAVLQFSNANSQNNSSDSSNAQLNVIYGLKRDIEKTLQSLFLSSPDMFVIPKLYHQYRHLFEMILQQTTKTLPDTNYVKDIYWTSVKKRNEIFCGTCEQNQLGNTSDINNSNNNSNSSNSNNNNTNSINSLQNNGNNNNNNNTDIENKTIKSLNNSVIETKSTTSERGEIDEEHIVHTLDMIGRHADSGHLILNKTGNDSYGWSDIRGHTAYSASMAIFGCIINSNGAIHSSKLVKIVGILCQWAISEARHGDWRAFLVSSILLCWRDMDKSTNNRRNHLQEALMEFLDNNISMTSNSNIAALSSSQTMGTTNETISNTPTSFLFDTFIRMHLFSYHRYLNRLTARGNLERTQQNQEDVASCLYHLKSLPLLHPAPVHLINQRRVALYGTRRDNNDKSRLEIEAIEQLKQIARQWIVGETKDNSLFGADACDMTEPVPNDTSEAFELALSDKWEYQLQQLLPSLTRYVIIQFTSDWLVKQVQLFVVKNIQIDKDNWRVMTSPGSCLLNVRQYIAIIKILDLCKDYINILNVALWVLQKSNDRYVLSAVIDTLQRYSNIWKLANEGNRVAKKIWEKHQQLQLRNIRERCIMMYMIQLVQEGFNITDEVRLQLQHDLQMKPKIRGRPPQISLMDELHQVISNDASNLSVQNITETLCLAYQYQNASLWMTMVLDGLLETIQQWYKKTASDSTLYVGDDQQRNQQLTLQRLLCAYADIIKGIVDQCTLTGQLNDVIVNWLLSKPIIATQSWMPFFIALLAARNLVTMDSIFYRFALPWFDQVNQHLLQEPEATTTTVNNQWLQVCENMMVLIRILVVQERCYWIHQNEDSIEDNSGTYQQPWVLRAEDVFRLQTLRYSRLAASLDKIEPMFALMEKLVLIASSLPLSSPLLQELVMLRADLLQIEWFRQACVRDLNGVYQRFSSHGTEASTEKKIKKKMLSIVDELIGGTLVDLRPHLHHAALVQEPDFIDKIRRVFMNVTQWNEEQCRVQVSLLLDNILLSDGGNTQNPNNPHILGGDDVTMHNNNTTSDSGSNNKDLDAFVRFFFDIALSSDDRSLFFNNVIHGLRKRVLLELLNYGIRLLEGCNNIIGSNEDGLSKQHMQDHASNSPTNQDQTHNDHSMTSSSSSSSSSISSTNVQQQQTQQQQHQQQKRLNVINSPSPMCALSTIPFPKNILLLSSMDEPFVSTRFTYKSQAFLNIMQHMMAQNIWDNNKKIDLIKTTLRHIKRFQSCLSVYQVMQNAHTTFSKAVAALEITKNNVDAAVTLVATEGIQLDQSDLSVTLQDLRTSLLIRIRLIVPFASLIWEYPKENECDALSWIRILVILLGNPVVHGNGSQERFFEFILDFVSLIIDEVPKDLRKSTLALLSNLHSELTLVPFMFQTRVSRILPFSTHNIYLSNSRLAVGILGAPQTSDSHQLQQHLETCMDQSKTWEWIEDYVSDPPHDNDASINLSLFKARKSRKVNGTYIRCRT
ncbi:hypothetical protein BJ944DRAFT_261581 [Cunninghamella echinulata]|nr:hypothetical protein BJ944DRAFT_261581 [Cunninghamella echinulata]